MCRASGKRERPFNVTLRAVLPRPCQSASGKLLGKHDSLPGLQRSGQELTHSDGRRTPRSRQGLCCLKAAFTVPWHRHCMHSHLYSRPDTPVVCCLHCEALVSAVRPTSSRSLKAQSISLPSAGLPVCAARVLIPVRGPRRVHLPGRRVARAQRAGGPAAHRARRRKDQARTSLPRQPSNPSTAGSRL